MLFSDLTDKTFAVYTKDFVSNIQKYLHKSTKDKYYICTTLKAWFKKDHNLQIHLHKTFFSCSIFLDLIHIFFFQIKNFSIYELQIDVSFIKLRFVSTGQLNFQQSNISCWKLWMFLVKCQTNTQSIVIFCPWFSQLAIAPMTGLRTKSVTKILENVCVWLNSLETDVKLVSKG